MKHVLKVFLLICLITILGNTTPVPAQDGTPWPTEGWQTSTPEAQGMDSEQLAALVKYIQDEEFPIDSVLVVRNGYLVMDAYFAPFDADEPHELYSVTKSVSSMLIGIALDKGYIESVDQPVLDFFPDTTFDNVDDLKESMTLEHVLTMTTGLDWDETAPYGSAENSLTEVIRSLDWAKTVLDMPMIEEPGTQFVYCTGCSHVLSAIISETTDMSAEEFADEYLFGPLGIENLFWPSDPKGVSYGGFGLRLTAHDLAKLGYLYLNKGEWDGEQIVSAEWVETSTQNQLETLPENSAGYGYQWWILPNDAYMAAGLFGQHIFVIPHLNMVVVFTSDIRDNEVSPVDLVLNYIIPAAESDTPLPGNSEGVELLETAIQEAAE